ncbi:MAG: molybdopterin-dependent oxidoreductase [Burkholderiaceae bacterium]
MSTVQRIGHCSHWGAYTLLVRDGRIIGVEPFAGDPDPSEIIESVPAWGDTRRRVSRPMARRSWLAARREGRVSTAAERELRGREPFEPLAWDEALDLVAGEIRRVAADFGNRSIFAGSYGWTSCGRFHHAQSQVRRLMNLVGGYTGHVDTYSVAAGPVILRHVLGDADACQGRSNTLINVARNSDTLLVFGAMARRTAQNEAGGVAAHHLLGDLKQVVESGTRIVLISPQRDDLPAWANAQWLPIRPNTDTALILALAGEIVAAGRHDADFLARYCSGSERFLDYLRGVPDGQPKTAAWAAGICGLPADAIRALAAALPGTRTMIAMSWSLQRAVHGEQPFWSAVGLASVLGQIGLPGGGVGFGYGSLGGVGLRVGLARPPAFPQLGNDLNSFIPVARITDMLEKPGASYDYEGKTRHYPDIRLIYWAGGNPYHHHQDLSRLERAWMHPETVIVQDPMWTATALRADVVLPASTSIERNDLAGNRRSDAIVAMKRAIAPIGEARSDYDIFSSLAGRLGVHERFTEGRDEMGWIRKLYEVTRDDARRNHGFEMPDFDRFWAEGIAAAPVMDDFTHLAEFRADPQTHALATESGRIVLGSEMLASRQYADCPPHPAWVPPGDWLDGPVQPAGLFHLLSPQPEGRLHSQLVHAGPSAGRIPDGREQLRLNPADAAALGLESGDVARVSNQQGACLAEVVLFDGIRRGVAALPTGAWLTPNDRAGGPELSGNVNVLTADLPTSRMGQGCAAQTCLARIEPWHDEAPPADAAFDALLARFAGS